MTKRLLDHNPLTGERVWFQYEQSTDQMTISHEQDVDSALDVAHALATDDLYSADGMKKDLWHYAKVPNSIILEMKQKHGVDFFDKNDAKRMFKLLNTEYARFKTTTKTHNIK